MIESLTIILFRWKVKLQYVDRGCGIEVAHFLTKVLESLRNKSVRLENPIRQFEGILNKLHVIVNL